MPTGAEWFVNALERLGVDMVFTLVGDHLNAVLSVLGRTRIRVVDMRHESAVTHAADAYGRTFRKPGVALVTGGPGHTNALTGLATAWQAASPMILVSGAASTALAGRQVFQVIDQVGMAAPVAKWAAQPGFPGHLPYYLGRAYQEAVSGRMGPVHLSVPVNVFEGTAESALPMPALAPPPEMAPRASEVEAALALLRAAERPVVIAGSGVWWADAGEELARFLERTQLPCYTITMARGVISDEHPLNFGYGDGALNKAVHKAFPEADVVLVVGKRIDYRLALGGPRLFDPHARFIQVDCVRQELGLTRELELGICADVKSTLVAMIEAAGEKAWAPRTAWLERLGELRAEWRRALAGMAADGDSPIHPAAFYAKLAGALPAGVLYSWDGGDFVHWGRAILPALTPGGWLRLGPLATIGSALPNAIALKLARPEAPVVLITGDGSLGFYLAELDTLVRYNLPVVVIVGNDAGWGVERELQRATCGTTVGCELRPTRYDIVMRGFGGEAENITSLDEVGPAVRRAFASGRPYLLNVNIRGVRSPFTEWQIGGKKPAAGPGGNR